MSCLPSASTLCRRRGRSDLSPGLLHHPLCGHPAVHRVLPEPASPGEPPTQPAVCKGSGSCRVQPWWTPTSWSEEGPRQQARLLPSCRNSLAITWPGRRYRPRDKSWRPERSFSSQVSWGPGRKHPLPIMAPSGPVASCDGGRWPGGKGAESFLVVCSAAKYLSLGGPGFSPQHHKTKHKTGITLPATLMACFLLCEMGNRRASCM